MVALVAHLRRLLTSARKGRRYIRQANIARDTGNYAAAAVLYGKALRKAPNHAAIHIQAGHMFKEAGDIVAAERHYVHALALAPDDRDVHLQLAHFYKNTGRLMQAYTHFERLAQIDPSAPIQELKDVRQRLGANLPANLAGVSAPLATSTSADLLLADEVRGSGLFDAGWYVEQYQDLGSADPFDHFFRFGRFELRRPSSGFDPHWYLKTYPQVIRSGLDPFTHYLTIGRANGLRPLGPPSYQRWISDYDTLDTEDRAAIVAHIKDANLAGPIAFVSVNADTGAGLATAISGLRQQLLKPRFVRLFLAADCPPAVRRNARALIGSDDRFSIVDADQSIEDIVAGQWIVLIDAAIELREHALYMLVQATTGETELVYADHDRIDVSRCRHDPVFKPAASPELLRQTNFFGSCALLPAEAVIGDRATGLVAGERTVSGIIRDVGMALPRAAITHVPFVLFHDHAEREAPASPPRPRLIDIDLPTVTIIVPTRDRLDLLRPCIESLRRETDYPAELIDIVVVDNGSVEDETLDWLSDREAAGDLRTLPAPIPFNYPILNNMAVESSNADVLILLNNDTEVQDPGWLRGLVGYVMQPDVGAVGPMLLYDDGTIQHAGVVLGVGGVAAHAHTGLNHDAPGALGFAQRTHEVAAVTGACLAMRRQVFDEIGGLDPGLPVAFNDVLLCLSSLKHGYRNLYVHDVWLRHYESKTRGRDDTVAKVKVYNREARYAREKYPELFRDDPFYSPNLSFHLPDMYEPAFPPRTVKPWRSYRRDRQRPRALLLSAASDPQSEIGTTVALQAAFLTSHGYDVVIGAPYSVMRGGEAAGSLQMLEDGRDAAAYAVAASFDVVVAHTPGYGEVSRWLGAYPPVVLHYHGAQVEALSGVPAQVFQQEARLMAAPFAARVVAGSTQAAAELSSPHAAIVPLGADRLGYWSAQFMPLRDAVRRARGWTDKSVVLVGSATDSLDAAMHSSLETLIPRFDAGSVAFVLLVSDAHPGERLPHGMTSVALADVAERQAVMIGADVFWVPDGHAASLDAAEAAALGLQLFSPGTSRADRTVVRALTRAVEAARLFDPWARRPAMLLGWSEVLGDFEQILAGLHGLTNGREPLGTMISAETLITESGLFDVDFYHAQNSDLASLDGYRHFVDHGHAEGRPASKLFDTDWYVNQYPEVRGAKGGPMLDYLRYPQGLRDPNPFFSNRAYLAALGERDTDDLAPLVHYLRFGAAEGLSIGDAFDADYYCSIYSDVLDSDMPAFAHFMTIGLAEGRIATRPRLRSIDLYDDVAVARAAGKPIEQSVPAQVTAVNSKSGAVRFIIALLRSRADLRHRFPQALSGGSDGAFAAWLAGDGGLELGLIEKAQGYVAAAFRSDPGGRIRQLLVIRPDLARLYPLGLTPAGAGGLLSNLIDNDLGEERIPLQNLWWFLLSVEEAPAHGLVETFLFTPVWQRLFPDGVTVFGRSALADWLRASFGLTADWADPATWPEPFTPAEQIRIAYHARPAWQAAHPAPFKSKAAAAALLKWLRTPATASAESTTTWLARLDQDELAAELVRPGLNILGHFCYASGLRTSTEALVEGFRRAGGASSLRDVWVQERGDEDRHVEYAGAEVHDITIIHTQPEPLFDIAYERGGLAPRSPRTYRIGYWYWELETIPPHWQTQADDVDEIWTATNFVGDALRKRFNIPVRVIMPGLEHPVFTPQPRSRFGLPEGIFLFLFTFHMASIMERKNPLGLISAFVAAFGNDDSVGLVLKTSFGHMYPEQMEELRSASAGYNIIIIDDVYSQEDVLALMDACDSYVSLHRSEGYGLTMAEAMLLGKPVIATGYSGNLDFMSNETSLLVQYDLITLERDYPPYKAGTRWAHASTTDAAECMRKVRDNPDWARALGARAKADLETRMSLAASGRKMLARIAEIERAGRSATSVPLPPSASAGVRAR